MKTPRERRCVVTGETAHEDRLLRVALSPDRVIVPDLAARLPGRGAWVSASREAVETAVRKKAFFRAFDGPVEVPEDLASLFERQIETAILQTLGLARRAGRLAIGYDAARQALAPAARPAWRIEASDGASDGRRKVDALAFNTAPGLPVLEAFDAETLGAALGRSGVVHLVLAEGPEARRITVLAGKLAGFRPVANAGTDGA